MKILYNVTIIGLGSVGSVLAKELGKYISCMKREGQNVIRLNIADAKEVCNEDVLSGTYIKREIGWNKAACLYESMMNCYGGMGQEFVQINDRISGYSVHVHDRDTLGTVLNHAAFGYHTFNEAIIDIICDCTRKSMAHASAISDYFKENPYVIVLSPAPGKIDVAQKLSGIIVLPYQRNSRGRISSFSDSLSMSYDMLASVISLLQGSQMPASLERFSPDFAYAPIDIKDKNIVIACAGCGGTGGNFLKESARLLLQNEDARLVLIDGDRAEEKNRERQPFNGSDIMQNKADVLTSGLLNNYPELNGRISSYPHYLESESGLEDAIRQGWDGRRENLVILIGCVDNHRARQVLEQYYQGSGTIFYCDCANEFDNGEAVYAVRIGGRELSPSRAWYFPEVLTDKSPSATELSCGTVNISSPQHQATNLVAASLAFRFVESILSDGKAYGGIAYFDTFTCTKEYAFPKKEVHYGYAGTHVAI